MVEITFSKIAGYLFGIPATLLGILLTLVGLLISTGFLVAGISLLIAGLVSMPWARSQMQKQADIGFSTGAVLGIAMLLSAVAMGGLVVGILNVGSDDTAEAQGYTGPGSDVSNVTVQAEDARPSESVHSLDITWNARAQSAVDPDPDDMSIYNAEDGQKFLVVRMDVTNTGNESLKLSPHFFRAVVDGVEYDPQSLFGSSQGGLSQVTVRPDASYNGWVVFSVPEDATSAEIIVDQDSYYFDGPASVEFTRDASMPIEVAD